MKSATALGVALTLVVGSFAWYAARAQEVAAPVPGSDARSEVAPAPVPAPINWPAVKPMTVVQMVDGKPVYETRTVVEATPGAPPYGLPEGPPRTPDAAPGAPPTQLWNAPTPAGVNIYGQPPMGMPLNGSPMPGYALKNGTVDIFAPRISGPFTRPIDEETAKQLNADRELQANLGAAVERYRNSDEGQRGDASNSIREIVAKQFEVRQHLRERELAELEARLGKLRELHAKRQQQKDQIINDRVQQVLRDADGLGWGDATPGGDVFFFKNGGGATLFGAPGGGAPVPVSEDMMIKVQAAKADAARARDEVGVLEPAIASVKVDVQGSARVQAKIRELEKKAWEKAQLAKQLAEKAGQDAEWAAHHAEDHAAEEEKLAAEEARHDAEQARDEVLREVEQARLEAMKEVAEARAETEQAAKEAHEEAARQEGEAKSESWEEHP